MFRVTTFRPGTTLQACTASYRIVEADFPPGSFREAILLPHVIHYLVFHLGAPDTLYDIHLQQFTGREILLGASKHYQQLRCFPGMKLLVVTLEPDGWYKLFHRPLPSAGLQNLAPFTEGLSRQLQTCTGTPQLVRLLDAFLQYCADNHKTPVRDISPAIRLIHDTNGNISLPELQAQTFTTKRTLERHFMEQTGLFPKMFARIVRFRHALEFMHRHQVCDPAQLAVQFGYYDRKHFLRECRALTGQLPATLPEQLFGQ